MHAFFCERVIANYNSPNIKTHTFAVKLPNKSVMAAQSDNVPPFHSSIWRNKLFQWLPIQRITVRALRSDFHRLLFITMWCEVRMQKQ